MIHHTEIRTYGIGKNTNTNIKKEMGLNLRKYKNKVKKTQIDKIVALKHKMLIGTQLKKYIFRLYNFKKNLKISKINKKKLVSNSYDKTKTRSKKKL
jgi:ribosomal protein S13